MNGLDYFIEPVKGHKNLSERHPHLIYRRSALPSQHVLQTHQSHDPPTSDHSPSEHRHEQPSSSCPITNDCKLSFSFFFNELLIT